MNKEEKVNLNGDGSYCCEAFIQNRGTRCTLYQRHFGDALDFVSFGHDQSRNAGSCDGGTHGESLLVDVKTMMPAAPRLGRREHSSSATHVTVGGLTRAMSTATTHARNTSHRAPGAPRGSRSLVTRFGAHLDRAKR